jgi:hypothetical protein
VCAFKYVCPRPRNAFDAQLCCLISNTPGCALGDPQACSSAPWAGAMP